MLAGGVTELRYLNFKDGDMTIDGFGSGLQIYVTLSKKVIIQRRIVYDTLSMLGDVGGLYELIKITLSAFCGFFA